MARLRSSAAALAAAALSLAVPAAGQVPNDEPRPPIGLPPELTGDLPDDETESDVLTIEKIVDTLVLSPSNREERALSAPAWVLTITREEIDQRGYEELTDLLDDLPSMDVIRPHGDAYFQNYWRGYRNLIGSPYLLLVDGQVFNHLYLNDTEIMAALPLTAVERVEVAYGPASAVYGPNAAMGVINVITRARHREEPGMEASTRFFLRAPTNTDFDFGRASKVADAFASYQGEGFRASVAGRIDVIDLDPSVSEAFEYTKNRYYEERRFYGDFLDRPELAGPFSSQSRKQAIDLRLGFGEGLEIGGQHYRMVAGTGLVYPGDRAPNRIPYVTLEQSAYMRYRHQIGDTFSATTLLRLRRSNIDSPTAWLEFDHAAQRVTFQYWQSTNFAYIATQDFSLQAWRGLLTDDDELVVDAGLRYERRDLERDYVRTGEYFWDPALPFTPVTEGGPTYAFPEPTDSERQLANRDQVDTAGVYALARYKLFEGHIFNLGFRLDYNSFFGEASPILRGGYVGRILPELTVKLLYGQAIQEPTRRELFGSFTATGSNLDLERERSQTLELSLSYQLDFLALQGNAYLIDVSKGLISVDGVPQNLGQRLVIGADLSAVALFELPFIRQLKIWLYYSPYILAEQSDTTSGAPADQRRPVGDLASHKVLAGVTVDAHQNFAATLLGRCLSSRDTVPSNPIPTVGGYCTLDANLMVRDLLFEGGWLSLRATNILDTQYFHPGIGEADSGATPGRFVGEVWEGSEGYFNSLLPQPRRAVALHLGLDF